MQAAHATRRKQLRQRWKTRVVFDEALCRRAWSVVYRVAEKLYADFAAARVIVFGSLTEPFAFTQRSDIDMAVSGLPSDAYDKACEWVWALEVGFKVDLINFDKTKGRFRERIQQQAIPIQRGTDLSDGPPEIWRALYEHLQQQVFSTQEAEIYEMYGKRVAQRIQDELTNIERVVDEIQVNLELLQDIPIQYKKNTEKAIATDLTDVYMGVENIFMRIAREIDGSVPSGGEWHQTLLDQMTQERPERPAVISADTRPGLDGLRNFRHKVRNIYGSDLDYEKVEPHALSVRTLFANLSADLVRFTDFLVATDTEA